MIAWMIFGAAEEEGIAASALVLSHGWRRAGETFDGGFLNLCCVSVSN